MEFKKLNLKKNIMLILLSFILISNISFSSEDLAKSILGDDAKVIQDNDNLAKSILGNDAKVIENDDNIAKSVLGKDAKVINYKDYEDIPGEIKKSSNIFIIIIISLIIILGLGFYFYKKR